MWYFEQWKFILNWNKINIQLPRIVALGSEFVRSDLSEGLFPLDVSVEAPEDNGFSVTHSSPSTLKNYVRTNFGSMESNHWILEICNSCYFANSSL